MRGVDKSNQNISYYHSKNKSIKWYRTLFVSALETTITNAYQLYKLRFPKDFFLACVKSEFKVKKIDVCSTSDQRKTMIY